MKRASYLPKYMRLRDSRKFMTTRVVRGVDSDWNAKQSKFIIS